MPDAELARAIARLKVAASDARYDEGSRICRQIAQRFRDLAVAEAAAATPRPAAAPPTTNGVAHGEEWVPVSLFAHEVQRDLRTVKKFVVGKPYWKKPTDRMPLVELHAARADWKTNGGGKR